MPYVIPRSGKNKQSIIDGKGEPFGVNIQATAAGIGYLNGDGYFDVVDAMPLRIAVVRDSVERGSVKTANTTSVGYTAVDFNTFDILTTAEKSSVKNFMGIPLDDLYPQTVVLQFTTLNVSAPDEEYRELGLNLSLSPDGSILAVTRTDADAYSSVYLFEKVADEWTEFQYMPAPTISSAGRFGYTGLVFSEDNNTLVISAAYDNDSDNSLPNSGVVYVYSRSAGIFNVSAELRASDKEASANFGSEVAMSYDANRIFIGSRSLNIKFPIQVSQSGAVYVFEKTAGSWNETFQFFPSIDFISAQIGNINALSCTSDGLTFVVSSGRINYDANNDFMSNCGAVFTCTLAGGKWTTTILRAPVEKEWHWFGYSSDISKNGDKLIVGAIGTAGSITYGGAYYVYDNIGGTWTLNKSVINNDSELPSHNLGSKVEFSEDATKAIVTATYVPDSEGVLQTSVGRVYIVAADNDWEETHRFDSPQVQEYERFGNSSALSPDGSELIVGANLYTPSNILTETGRVLFYKL